MPGSTRPSSGQTARSRPSPMPGRASSSNAVRRRPSLLMSRPWRAASLGVRVRLSSRRRPSSRAAHLRANASRRLGLDQPQRQSGRRQTLVGIVGAQAQAVFGARGEHAIGLGDAARHQVVDHHAHIAVGARDDEIAPTSGRLERGVDAGGDTLGARLLVAGGAVDLAGQEQPRQPLDLERRGELAGVHVVVLDGIAEAPDGHPLQPRNGAQEGLLHVGRKRGGDAVGIDGVVVQALGLQEDLVGRAGRQSAPPCPRWRGSSAGRRCRSGPEYMGERARLARMMAWVASVVVVTPQLICAFSIRSVRNEKGMGGSSPACISRLAQSIVRPSRRAGVPVLSRPSRRSSASSRWERPLAGGSPWRPAGVFSSPRWIRPRRKVPVVSTTEPARIARPSAVTIPATAPFSTSRSSTAALDHLEVRRRPDRGLHGGPVELAVGLGARALHGRPLGAVEQAELDAGRIRHPPHQAIKRIDLAHQMALAEPADGRIAGHLADGGKAVRDQRRARAHAGSRRRGLAAGMAAADNDDVEGSASIMGCSGSLVSARNLAKRAGGVKTSRPQSSANERTPAPVWKGGTRGAISPTSNAGSGAPDSR